MPYKHPVSAIYVIAHRASGKVYVGSAKNLRARWAMHRRQLRNGLHHNALLQRAWTKYGADAFSFCIAEVVDCSSDLLSCEQKWIDFCRSCDRVKGYNIAPIAGSALGTKRTKAQLEAMPQRPQGHRATGARFTESQVLEIKRLLIEGESHAEVARKFGVAFTTVRNISLGKTYRNTRCNDTQEATILALGGKARGQNHHFSKVTKEVAAVIQEIFEGKKTRQERYGLVSKVSQKYDVSPVTVHKVLRGEHPATTQ